MIQIEKLANELADKLKADGFSEVILSYEDGLFNPAKLATVGCYNANDNLYYFTFTFSEKLYFRIGFMGGKFDDQQINDYLNFINILLTKDN